MLSAVFLTWLLEYRHFINDAGDAFSFVHNHTKIFFYNSLIMFTILGIIYGLVRKVFTAVSIGTIAVLIIGYIHIAKFGFRGTPLFPEDFSFGSQAGTLTKFIDMSQVMRLVLAVILVLILGIMLDRLTAKWLKRETTMPSNVWWRRYRIVSRVAIVALSVCGFMITTDFIRHHGKEREIPLPMLNSKFTDWNQVTNYSDNGFLIGFLYNTTKLVISEPAGYSENQLKDTSAELTTEKTDSDKTRVNISDADINVIIVLNESFYDPSIITKYYDYTGGDVTPNLHEIQKNTPSGYMFSPDYGGGTANIEYEILTGLTNHWLKTVPYTNLIPREESVPSIASYFREQGLHTATVHPFVGGMYKRDAVLPKLGFEDFVDIHGFSDIEKEGSSEYANDRTAYKKALEYIKSTEQKDFISLITMQNHAPYIAKEYGEPEFVVTNVQDGAEKDSVETYMMTLHKSDEYLGEFINSLKEFDEKTIVLLYGDHAPGVYPDVLEEKNASVSHLARLTPYIIYANFDYKSNYDINNIKNAQTEAELSPVTSNYHSELPTTTPNCLGNLLLNYFNLEKPKNFYLLDTICKETPVLTDVYFGNKAPISSTELSKYNLLTYDLVTGKQYSLH